MSPKITVLMCVYNGRDHLGQAVESVLGQSFGDFEFLIIDDGSTDGSAELAESYSDPRVRVERNPENIGLTRSLNKGLSLARGEYLARMDHDDVCSDRRLEIQSAFLDSRPRVGVCGTWMELFGAGPGEIWSPPADDADIRCDHIFECRIFHPTVMLRLALLRENNIGYDESLYSAQDYDLWVRLSELTGLANIPQVLLRYRMHENKVGKRYSRDQAGNADKVRAGQIARLGLEPGTETLALHSRLSLWDFESSKDFVTLAGEWLSELSRANLERHLFPEPQFTRALARRWFAVCSQACGLGAWVVNAFQNNSLSVSAEPGFRDRMKFYLKCAIKYKETSA